MAACVEDAVIGRLKADAAVASLTGGRVYPQYNTQEPTLPLIVVAKLGSEGNPVLKSGAASRRRYSVKVDVYANTEADAANLAGAVLASLCPPAGWTDSRAVVLGAFLDDASEDFTQDGFRIDTQTFGVWWSPPPTPASLVGAGLGACLLPADSRRLGLLYQDAAKTIRAAADGDPVRVATCPYTGLDWTAPSDSSRPVLHTDGTAGHWWLSFDGVDDVMGLAARVGGPPFTLAFAGRPTSLSGTPTAVGPEGFGYTQYRINSDGRQMLFAANNGAGILFGTGVVAAGADHVWAATLDGTNLAYYLGGAADGGGTFTVLGAGKGPKAAGGRLDSTAEIWTGRLYGVVTADVVLSASNLALVNTYLAGLMP